MASKFIKFLHSPSGKPFNLGYFPGDEVVLPAGQAEELIELGYAREITDKPAPIPGKKLSFTKQEQEPKKPLSRRKKAADQKA
jgi:hypothetical protein